MTQSPLSRQIQVLERSLGVMLLERTSRQVALTPAGRMFLLEARRIVRLADSAALAARRIAHGDAGRLSIGFTAVSGYHLIPRIVAQSRVRLPNIDLELREMVSGDQIDALLTGLIDIGFVRQPIDRPEFTSIRVQQQALVAALPSNDPRGAKADLTLGDFDGLPLIMYSRQGAGYFHDLLVRLFGEAGITPRFDQHVTQIHSMLGLVDAGLAAAIVPEQAQGLTMNDVCFRPLRTIPERPCELHMISLPDNPNPVLESVASLCKEVAAAC